MWARFTVLSDTAIAFAIVGCVIPLSRSNTIWMRWRCSGCPFQPSAVFKRRICFLVHLTICLSESDQMVRENHTPTLECNSLRHSVPQYRSTSIQSALETVLAPPIAISASYVCLESFLTWMRTSTSVSIIYVKSSATGQLVLAL